MFFEALEKGHYACYLTEGTALPMIYIDQCIDATIRLMKADKSKLTKTAYNLGGISFTPGEFLPEVQKLIPGLKITYDILESKQGYADGWPKSIDDKHAKEDWGWEYNVSVGDLARQVLVKIDDQYKKGRELNL